jgi:hypothetical protein
LTNKLISEISNIYLNWFVVDILENIIPNKEFDNDPLFDNFFSTTFELIFEDSV